MLDRWHDLVAVVKMLSSLRDSMWKNINFATPGLSSYVCFDKSRYMGKGKYQMVKQQLGAGIQFVFFF